jgi:hypothetical protein
MMSSSLRKRESMGPSPPLPGFRDYARNDEHDSPSVMLRAVAASRGRSVNSRLRGNDDLFEFCGANDMTYLIAEACALMPHESALQNSTQHNVTRKPKPKALGSVGPSLR